MLKKKHIYARKNMRGEPRMNANTRECKKQNQNQSYMPLTFIHVYLRSFAVQRVLVPALSGWVHAAMIDFRQDWIIGDNTEQEGSTIK